jgi:purine-binding chemotaxis protein CheW
MNAVHVRLRVGGEAYAFAVENVLEVAELGEIAPVPGMPAAVLGVRNLRGEVLPVFDLATVFGIGRERDPERLLVAEHDGRHAGFAIDEVTDVGTLPPVTEETQSKLLSGAALDDSGLIGVIDIERLYTTLSEA